MKTMKHLKKFNEQFDNKNEDDISVYQTAIEYYEKALLEIKMALFNFENTSWGVPEYFDKIFG